MNNKKLVYGVGINDAGYVVQNKYSWYEAGKLKQKRIWACPYYSKWSAMLRRCYSEKFHSAHLTYKDCTVSEEWKTFSNFRKWMVVEEEKFNSLNLENLTFKELHLDKDFLSEGNKHYSRSTCTLIHGSVNNFIVDCSATRGDYLIGVNWCKRANKFQTSCCNPFTKKSDWLGRFDSEQEAHGVWKGHKHSLSVELANSCYVWDERIRQRLLSMYK